MQFAIEVIFLCKKICLMTLLKSWIKQQLHIQLFCMPSIIVRKRQAILLGLQNNLNNKPLFLKHSAHLKLPGIVHTKSVLILLLAVFSCRVLAEIAGRSCSLEDLAGPWRSQMGIVQLDATPSSGSKTWHRAIALAVQGFQKDGRKKIYINYFYLFLFI